MVYHPHNFLALQLTFYFSLTYFLFNILSFNNLFSFHLLFENIVILFGLITEFTFFLLFLQFFTSLININGISLSSDSIFFFVSNLLLNGLSSVLFSFYISFFLFSLNYFLFYYFFAIRLLFVHLKSL